MEFRNDNVEVREVFEGNGAKGPYLRIYVESVPRHGRGLNFIDKDMTRKSLYDCGVFGAIVFDEVERTYKGNTSVTRYVKDFQPKTKA